MNTPQPHTSDESDCPALQLNLAHLSRCCCTAGSPEAENIRLFQAEALPLPHDPMRGENCHWCHITVSNLSHAAGLPTPQEHHCCPGTFRPCPYPRSVAEGDFPFSFVCHWGDLENLKIKSKIQLPDTPRLKRGRSSFCEVRQLHKTT